MYKGELFNYRYGEILAAINDNPGISNAELVESFRLSYNIIRALTAAMNKEGDITGRVERWGLYSKTLWFGNANKNCLQEPEGRVSIATRTATPPQAAHAVRVRVAEEYSLPAKHGTKPSEVPTTTTNPYRAL